MPDTPKLKNLGLQRMVEDVLKEIKESQCIRITCEPCTALRFAEKVITALRDEVVRYEKQFESGIPEYSQTHADMIELMKNQLLIVFVNRLGGKISIPVEEIDGTGSFNLLMNVIDKIFTFEVQEKQ